MRIRVLLTAIFAVAVIGCAQAAKYELPERILSGYGGWFLGQKQDSVRWIMDRMQEAAFNSVELKIQNASGRVFPLDEHMEETRSLMQYAVDRGLLFQLYLYPSPHNGGRVPEWEEHRQLPCTVDGFGSRLENVFLLTDERCWRQLFFHAFIFLANHDRLPFSTLKFDLETIPGVYSYDDANWRKFCDANHALDAQTPATERLSVLKKAGKDREYEQYFRNEVRQAIRGFVAALRKVDPDVILGYMPGGKGVFHYVEFEKELATNRLPAVIDNWAMYNGLGYTDRVVDLDAASKSCNPANVTVSWIRPDSYSPEAISAAVYQTACHVKGYSIWSLCQHLSPDAKGLPRGATVAQYYEAFRKANLALREDMKEGTLSQAARIPRETLQPRAAPLSWEDIRIPQLKPVGDGSGADQYVCTRERSVFHIYAESGKEIQVSIRHDAGDQRPIGVHYVLLDDEKQLLREEVVHRSQEDSWKVVAPKTGVYTLVVSGGLGGQAWYSVKIGNGLHYALSTEQSTGKAATIFRRQSVTLPGPEFGNAKVHVGVELSTVVLTPDEGNPIVIKRPIHETDVALTKTQRILFARHPDIGYFDGATVSFPNGRTPYVWGTAGRGLAPR